MNDTVSVRRYQRADREATFALLRAGYPSAGSERLIRQWDWKYDANPFNREADPYVLLLKDGAQLIGMLGALPLRMVIRGTEHWASHSCDWVVRPDYRDRGVARRLVLQHRNDYLLHFSWENELSHRRSRSFSNTRHLRLTSLVKPLDAGYVLQRLTQRHFLNRVGGVLASGACYVHRRLRTVTTIPGVAISPIDSFDYRFDALWQRVSRDYPVALVRDQRYLNWRFVSRPDVRYTILAATRGAQVAGYLVLRLADKAGVRWGYVVDFLVENRSRSLISLLLEHAVEHLRREEVKGVSCRVIRPPYRRQFYRHGFLPIVWGPRGYLRVDFASPDPAAEDFQDPKRWFVTMGDGDIEMDS